MVEIKSDSEEEEEPSEFGNIKEPSDLNNLLQEAAKLKSAQLDEKRREYVGSPAFMQNTLHPGDDVKSARQAAFADKLETATSFKSEGNERFKAQEYVEAVAAYTKCISVFRYFEDDGEDRPLREVLGASNEDERKQVVELLVSCYTNVAACLLKTEQNGDVIYACDQVLKQSPENIKALYRRAMANIGLEKQGGTIYMDKAVGDLQLAHKIDPKNREVKVALQKYRKLKGEQDSKDRGQFQGMFGRGEIYSKEATEQTSAPEGPPIPGAVQRDGMWYDGKTGRILI